MNIVNLRIGEDIFGAKWNRREVDAVLFGGLGYCSQVNRNSFGGGVTTTSSGHLCSSTLLRALMLPE